MAYFGCRFFLLLAILAYVHAELTISMAHDDTTPIYCIRGYPYIVVSDPEAAMLHFIREHAAPHREIELAFDDATVKPPLDFGSWKAIECTGRIEMDGSAQPRFRMLVAELRKLRPDWHQVFDSSVTSSLALSAAGGASLPPPLSLPRLPHGAYLSSAPYIRSSMAATTTSTATRWQKLAFIIVDMQTTKSSFTQASITEMTWDDTKSTSKLVNASTFGRIQLHRDPASIFGPVTIPFSPSDCSTNSMAQWRPAAEAGAQIKHDIDLNNWDVKIFALPYQVSCGWGGLALLNCIDDEHPCWIYIKDKNAQLLAHELGHNYGLTHAAAVEATGTVEYGDNSCFMGYSTYYRQLNLPHVAYGGWLSPPGAIREVANEITRTPVIANAPLPQLEVGSYEKIAVQGEKSYGMVGLRWPSVVNSGSWFYLSTRSKVDQDWILDDLFVGTTSVHRLDPGGKTFLLDILSDCGPGTHSSCPDLYLPHFTSPAGEEMVKINQTSYDPATGRVTVGLQGCFRGTGIVVTPTHQSVARGSVATFNVQLYNSDTAACGGGSKSIAAPSTTESSAYLGPESWSPTGPFNVSAGSYASATLSMPTRTDSPVGSVFTISVVSGSVVAEFELEISEPVPTAVPTASVVPPSASPSPSPTISPMTSPTASPSATPTTSPAPTSSSTPSPTASPTSSPTASPTTSPTASPTSSPSTSPTSSPSTSPTSTSIPSPTTSPTITSSPTTSPSSSPTYIGASPTTSPTGTATITPSPTSSPTASPTSTVTRSPSTVPTASTSPSAPPTAIPTPTQTPSPLTRSTATNTPTTTPTPTNTSLASPNPAPAQPTPPTSNSIGSLLDFLDVNNPTMWAVVGGIGVVIAFGCGALLAIRRRLERKIERKKRQAEAKNGVPLKERIRRRTRGLSLRPIEMRGTKDEHRGLVDTVSNAEVEEAEEVAVDLSRINVGVGQAGHAQQPTRPPPLTPSTSRARAVWDYEPEAGQPDEIGMREGDVVTVLNDIGDGWARVKHGPHWANGKTGIVPMNRLEYLDE